MIAWIDRHVGRRTQRAVDAVMAWLHWRGMPKSAAMHHVGIASVAMILGMTAAISADAAASRDTWLIVGASIAVTIALPLSWVRVSMLRDWRRTDERAEEAGALTPRDVPADRWTCLLYGGFAIAQAILTHSLAGALVSLYGTATYLHYKAHASPRVPAPPAHRLTVPALGAA